MIELNKIYNEDCLIGMEQIPDGSIDAVICDLPYQMTDCAWDVALPFDELWRHYKRVCKKNAAICLFGIEPFSSKMRISNLKMFKYDWIYQKSNLVGFLNAKKQPLQNYENVSVFYKEQCVYNPQKRWSGNYQIKHRNKTAPKENYGAVYSKFELQTTQSTGETFPHQILYGLHDKEMFNTGNGGKEKYSIHPTQKPIKLLEYLIKTYTNENETVLDNCSGRGSLAIAAINTGRNYICFEKDEGFYKSSSERVRKHQPPMLPH